MSCTERRTTGLELPERLRLPEPLVRLRSRELPEQLRLPVSLVPLGSWELPERLRLPEPSVPPRSLILRASPGLQVSPDSTG